MVYQLVRLQANFFQPVNKLVEKHWNGAVQHRRYDRAQTPFQRMFATGLLAPTKEEELTALYRSLNPLQLQRQLDAALTHLWTLITPSRSSLPTSPPVTQTSDSSSTLGNPDL